MKKLILIALSALMFFSCAAARTTAGEQATAERTFAAKVYTSSTGQHLPYRILYPENFDPLKSYPVLLFMHGSGERGTDNELQLVHGRTRLETDPLLRQMIVVVPQCPIEDYWVRIASQTQYEQATDREFPYDAPISMSLLSVKELLDCFVGLGIADPDKLYATGLSMGGMAVLDLMLRYPDYFVAIQPICGAVNAQRCAEFKGRTRIRFIHGLDDPAVPACFSQEDFESFKAAGADVEYIAYPGVGHNSWDNAFEREDFISWFIK